MSSPTPSPEPDQQSLVKVLSTINRLTIEAFSASSRQALIFHILNETSQLRPYDRATLWSFEGRKPTLLGVSGHSEFSDSSELSERWQRLVQTIKDPHDRQILNEKRLLGNLEDWHHIKKELQGTTILWIPLCPEEGLISAGLWLERWNGKKWQSDEEKFFTSLSRAYGLAWRQFNKKRIPFQRLFRGHGRNLAVAALIASFLVRIPLRVVAPCEVVPNDPILITAPLNGIIHQIDVVPGENVEKGTQLFQYDKRVPLQELKVAQKELEITESELNRTMTQGVNDSSSLAEYAVLELKLQKDQLNLDLAEYRASQLRVISPGSGVAMLDNPEEWRGKPVKLGERVMVITDPHNSKVKIWVPESDNVILDRTKPVKVFLNVNPSVSHIAQLSYIASFTGVNEQQIPGFEAEAQWTDPKPEVKMGLKGTAILYGENVTLFYYLIRKPWAFLRNLIGF